MIRAIRFLGLLFAFALLACTLDPDEDDGPATTAGKPDPKCHPGGAWNDSLGACEYSDQRPPIGP